MSCADDAWVSFGRREGFGLDWAQLPCEEAQPACRGGGSGGHLLFCWGHYGSPLSRCWSVLAAHRCSSTPADKCHVSRWFQRCWLGLLEGQVDNSDVYSRTAPQSLAPAGMVMPSGNEWIGGSHHLYHMPRSDPTLAPEKNGKKSMIYRIWYLWCYDRACEVPGSIPGLMSQINKHACKTVCDVNPGIDPGPSQREKIGKFYLSVFQSFA